MNEEEARELARREMASDNVAITDSKRISRSGSFLSTIEITLRPVTTAIS
jgi:hypothetical protein